MKATRVFTAEGYALTVESGDGRCWDSEEVSDFEVEVEDGTMCDICEEPIQSPGAHGEKR